MVPYYDCDGIVIYNARCEDVLPSIDPATVDLLLTDPPYGINLNTEYGARCRGKGAPAYDYAPVAGDDEPFDPSPLLAYGRCILWGANNYADLLPPTASWIVWDRLDGLWSKRGQGYNDGADAELAWTNLGGTVRTFRHRWQGYHRKGEAGKLHPTQKPTDLMRWLVDKHTNPDDLVLDPYMGSGPVAQACHELGRRYVGVELVEDYCRIAVSRLAQQTLNFDEAS